MNDGGLTTAEDASEIASCDPTHPGGSGALHL